MCIGGISLRVGDDNNRSALPVQLGKQLHHFDTVDGVEIARRLIGKQQFAIGY